MSIDVLPQLIMEKNLARGPHLSSPAGEGNGEELSED